MWIVDTWTAIRGSNITTVGPQLSAADEKSSTARQDFFRRKFIGDGVFYES